MAKCLDRHGTKLTQHPLAELRVFFSSQERLANRLQEQNNLRQGRQNNRVRRQEENNNNNGRRFQRARYSSNRSTTRRTPTRGGSTNNRSRSNTRRNNNPGQLNPESTQTPNNALCPVHRSANHTWGECRQNAQNVCNTNNSNGSNTVGSNRRSNHQQRNNAAEGNAAETNNNEGRDANIIEDPSQAGTDEAGDEPIIVDLNAAEVADVHMPD